MKDIKGAYRKVERGFYIVPVFLFVIAAAFFSQSVFAEEPSPPPPKADEAKVEAKKTEPIPIEIRYLRAIDARASGNPIKGISKLLYDEVHGELYIVDHLSRRVLITDGDGVPLFSFSYEDAGIKSTPVDIKVDRDGNIYVAESKRISVVSYRGVYKRDIDLSQAPSASGGAIDIQSIAVDRDGKIFIGGGDKITALDKNGKFVFQIVADPAAHFSNATRLSVDDSGAIYVLDFAKFKVYLFDRDGRFLSSFGKVSSLLGGFSMPVDMVVDRKTGRIAVLDINRYGAIFFGNDGRFLYEVGGADLMRRPISIAMDEKGRIFVADSTNMIKIFEIKEVDSGGQPGTEK